MHHETTEPDQAVLIEIDGEGVSPSTVDAASALELAGAFLRTMQGVASQLDVSLALRGLEVIDKCAALRVHADPPELALECAKMASLYVAGRAEPPYGQGERVALVRAALGALGEGRSARVIVGPWRQRLDVPEIDRPRPMDSITTLRAVPLRVGGVQPRVLLKSELEDATFSLRTDRSLAQRLGAFLYQPVEITARVSRDENGLIVDGQLEGFEAVEDGDARAAWRSWLRTVAGSYWDDVEDLESELRDGP